MVSNFHLKGCSLHCVWCHNPEAIALNPELMLYLERCIGCETCFEVCPSKFGAVTKISGEPVPSPIPEEKRIIIRKSKEK